MGVIATLHIKIGLGNVLIKYLNYSTSLKHQFSFSSALRARVWRGGQVHGWQVRVQPRMGGSGLQHQVLRPTMSPPWFMLRRRVSLQPGVGRQALHPRPLSDAVWIYLIYYNHLIIFVKIRFLRFFRLSTSFHGKLPISTSLAAKPLSIHVFFMFVLFL